VISWQQIRWHWGLTATSWIPRCESRNDWSLMVPMAFSRCLKQVDFLNLGVQLT
jgi:hypothetical protein